MNPRDVLKEGYVRLWCLIGGKVVEEKKEPFTSETLPSGHKSFWWIAHGNDILAQTVLGAQLELGRSPSPLGFLQCGLVKHLIPFASINQPFLHRC